jgi:stage V sporulation protein R
MASKMLSGSPVLLGDNTIPGARIPKEVNDQLPTVFKACKDFGLDFYPTVVEFLTYDEISEVAAYGGFPVRFPHWQFGMEYEELTKGYEHGMHRIYEMVINTSPCYIYCLDSNTLVDNITVVAHALGHNDFFKNNIYFSATNTGMLNKMANHGTRIRNYIARYGKDKVIEFIDHLLRIDTLIDPYDAWGKKEYNAKVLHDERHYRFPNRTEIPTDQNYMQPWINTKARMDKERDRIEVEEAAEEIGAFAKPTKNIFGWLKDHAPLKPWQQDIASMIYEESMYFAPQRMTKMANEGWASFVDYKIMAEQGFVCLGQTGEDGEHGEDMGIVEYAAHKMGVLGGKYSMNPYKLGFKMFLDIEERWNKGRFGDEYDNCTDQKTKENWDTGAMLGKQKVFEVRSCYNDVMMLHEFFTDDFCQKNEFFDWKLYPNGEYRIESRDTDTIRKKLIQRYSNGGLPDIRLTDPNHLGRGWLCLEHKFEGRALYRPYVEHTLVSLFAIWKNVVVLSTKDNDGEEYVYVCESEIPKEVVILRRKDYDKKVLEKADRMPPIKD